MSLKGLVSSTSGAYFALTALQINVVKKALSLGRYRVEFPGGFSYGAFNGVAQIKPWSLLRMVEASRGAVFCPSEDGTTFLDTHITYKNYLMFILSSTLQVKKEFYDIDLVKAPVVMDIELDHIGSTSFQLKTSGYVSHFPDPMFVSQVKTVLVCSKTRKPKPPPEWWFEKYSKEIPAGAKPMDRLDMSDGDESRATEINTVVHAADVDGYLHTNWANYVKYCFNAYVQHRMANAGVESHREIFRQVKDLSTVYKKELSIGDSLISRVLPHQTDPNIFFFSLQKDKNVCCECKIEYYPL